MDEGSATLLGELISSVEGTKTLAIVNFRPEYDAAAGRAPSTYRGISLEPLGPDDTRELLRDLAGEDPSLDGLADLIHERTAGNPFFIEEIVRGLAEAGNLEGERGAYRLARPVEDTGVPASVQTILAARIDRLGPSAKQLLQAASVTQQGDQRAGAGHGLRAERGRGLPGGALRADRRRLPLRDRGLPGTGLRLPPPADPRGRLQHPAGRAARRHPRGDGAGPDRAQPRPPRRAGGPDRQPHGGGRRDAGSGALVGASRLLGGQQPPAGRAAPLAQGDGADRRAGGDRGDDGDGGDVAAAAARLRLAPRHGRRGGSAADRRSRGDRDADRRPALAGAAQGRHATSGPGMPHVAATWLAGGRRDDRPRRRIGRPAPAHRDPRRRLLRPPLHRRLRRLRPGARRDARAGRRGPPRRRRDRHRQPGRLGDDGQGTGAARARPARGGRSAVQRWRCRSPPRRAIPRSPAGPAATRR